MTDSIKLSKVCPHPKSVDMYGEPEPKTSFIDDVDENGIRVGIKITEDSHYKEEIEDRWGIENPVVVLSGHKRIEAATECGMDEIKVDERKEYETKPDEFEAVRMFNDYRDKTFSQRMREGESVYEIERMRAKRRKESNLKQNTDMEDIPSREGTTRDEVADEIGIGSGRHYSKAKKIWNYAHENDEHENIPSQLAEWMVGRIDEEEESVSGCYNTLRDLEKEAEEPDEPEEEETQESDENKDKYSIIESAYGDSGLVERIKSYVAEKGISKSVVLEMKELTGEDGTASEFQNRLWFDQGDIDELPSEEDDSDEEEKAENGSKESLDDIAKGTTEDEEKTDSTPDESTESVTTDSEQSEDSFDSSDTQTEETDESDDMERSEETDVEPVSTDEDSLKSQGQKRREEAESVLSEKGQKERQELVNRDDITVITSENEDEFDIEIPQGMWKQTDRVLVPDDFDREKLFTDEDSLNLQSIKGVVQPRSPHQLEEEHVEAVREAAEETQEAINRIMNDPQVLKNGRTIENLQAHMSALGAIQKGISCPECGAGAESLEWTCCGNSVEEAHDIAEKQAKESQEETDYEAISERTGTDGLNVVEEEK